MTQPIDSSSQQSSRLRLVGQGPSGSVTLRFTPAQPPKPARGEPANPSGADAGSKSELNPTDPRWVLAVRTQQVLQGAMLRPADRQELVRVGRLIGLNPFDANLVIAIVQDQARRGGSLDAAAASLRRVPVSREPENSPAAWRVARWCAAVLVAEVFIIWAII